MAEQPAAVGETTKPNSAWFDEGTDEPNAVPSALGGPGSGAAALRPQSPLVQPDQSDIGKYEAGLAAAQQPYLKKVDQALNSPRERTAQFEKIKDEPNPQDYHKYSMEFASAAAVLGAVAGRFTRAGGTASLNAFSGALKGWQTGNLQAYEEASKQWEQATKKTLENNNIELEKYHEILNDRKLNIDEAMQMMTIAGSEFQNSVITDMAKTGNFNGVAQAVDKMAMANQRLQGAFGQLSDVRNNQSAQVSAKVNELNNNPALAQRIKQEKPTDWLNLKGTAQALGLTLNEPPEGTVPLAKVGAPAIDLSNPQQAPEGVKQRDWDIWADYERYTGKQPSLGWGPEMNAYKTKLSLWANERQAQGIPIDEAAQNMAKQQAFYTGQVSGARSVGTRGANIEMAANLATVAIPQALKASEAFPRGQFTPVNAAKLQAYEAGSSVPVSEWDIANLQIAEMYARALNPTGNTIRKDMFDRAVAAISQAKSPEAYKATLQSIYQAMQREKQGIAATQQQQRGQEPNLPDPFAGSDDGWGEVKVH